MSFAKLYKTLANASVNDVADDALLSVEERIPTILTAPTGSGKTLLLPTRLSDYLEEQVVVLVPRRFLAVNAAETVAMLSRLAVGDQVGYAVGSQSGETSKRSRETRVLYATYGYALASGLVWKAVNFMLDEVHERTLAMSIVRAIIRYRADREPLRILETSATLDLARQAAYWGEESVTLVAKGQMHDCERLYYPAMRIEEAVRLLVERGRKGILVFRPGVAEVEETAERIKALLPEAEVAQIYGEMSYTDRAQAIRPPADGIVKILVSTNVMESGANVPWLDAGVTCGTGKENHVREESGATHLMLDHLAQWRLEQQEGRVKRFCPGIFILCSQVPWDKRPQETIPEIRRLALTELVLQCAKSGLRTDELKFDYPPDVVRVHDAEVRLQNLGLINQNCELTEAGTFAENLPVGPGTKAMLWHAYNLGCLPQAIGIAAVEECSLRKMPGHSHGRDRTSDVLDGLKVFILCRDVTGSGNVTKQEVLDRHNVSGKRLEEVKLLIADLEGRLQTKVDLEIDDWEDVLRQCILAGMLDNLFVMERSRLRVVSSRSYFELGQGASILNPQEGSFIAGRLRVIQPRNTSRPSRTVVEGATLVTLDDVEAIAELRPEILEVRDESRYGIEYKSYYLLGNLLTQTSKVQAQPSLCATR